MIYRRGLALAVVPILIACHAAAARAASDQGTLDVHVQVQVTCTVTAGSLDFGTYVSGQRDPLQGEGSIGYDDCPAGDLLVALDSGTNGSRKSRAMRSGAGDRINYQLYRNPERKQVWGTGKSALEVSLDQRGSGRVPVYGTVLGGQSVPAGDYSDTVNVTLSF